MYLCVSGNDFEFFYDFSIEFGTSGNVECSFYYNPPKYTLITTREIYSIEMNH